MPWEPCLSLKVRHLEELAPRKTRAAAKETIGPGSKIKDLFALVYLCVQVDEATGVQGLRGQ